MVKFGSSTGLLSTSHSPGFPPVLWSSNVTLLQSRFGGGSKQLQHNNRQHGYVWCPRLYSEGMRKINADVLADALLARESRDHGMLAVDDYAMVVLATTRVVGLVSWSSLLQSNFSAVCST